jgi:hypothetical protein
MDNSTREDLEEALAAMASMIGKTEPVKRRFAPGTSQHTLQKNRLAALKITSSLISKELEQSYVSDFGEEDLRNAHAPIASLISKCEKARNKLAPGTCQHTMLSNNLKALHIASPLLTKALQEISAGKGF